MLVLARFSAENVFIADLNEVPQGPESHIIKAFFVFHSPAAAIASKGLLVRVVKVYASGNCCKFRL